MRDILFRGKRADNGEWVYGDLIQLFGGQKYIIDNKFGACIDDKGNFINTEAPFVCEVIPETVGQYTGLKGKNGKKIFEGDICEVTVFTCEGEDKHFLCEVCFEYHSFIFRNLKRSNFDIPFSDIYDFSTDVEVIGNIHDKKLEDFENGC